MRRDDFISISRDRHATQHSHRRKYLSRRRYRTHDSEEPPVRMGGGEDEIQRARNR